jgi:NAD(P)-dependent dehydrogenase (short-subunit alcohol dehydrogenase family)
MTTTETNRPPSAAITGAGGGQGRELALQLGSKGYTVFGTARSDNEREELSNASNGRAQALLRYLTHSFRPFELFSALPAADTPMAEVLDVVDSLLGL